MRRVRDYLLLALVLLATITASSLAATFTLLHTNDFHGKLKPFKRSNYLHLGTLYVSGYPNIATIVKLHRAEGSTLYVDAGDWITGSLLCDYYHGESVIWAMNILKPDAATIGNHEFDWGVDGLNKLLREAKFDVVVANVFPERGSRVKLENVKPFVIKEVGGVRVGIIGVVTPETPQVTLEGNTRGLKFVKPERVLKEYISYLKPRVDMIIVLSHNGKKEDVKIAEHVQGIDIIVGGHSHTKLAKPIEVNNGSHRTYVLQAYKYGMFVGRAKVKVENGKVAITQYNLLPVIDEVIPDDPETGELITKLNEKLAPIANRVIAELPREFTRYEITRFSAEIARKVTGADVGAMNTGGIRRPLGPGKVTYEQLYACFPFHNYLVVVELKGKDLRELIRLAKKKGNMLLSGVDMRRLAPEELILINGAPLKDEATYRVATVDFLARGGDGYTPFKCGKIVWRGLLFREVMEKHLGEITSSLKRR